MSTHVRGVETTCTSRYVVVDTHDFSPASSKERWNCLRKTSIVLSRGAWCVASGTLEPCRLATGDCGLRTALRRRRAVCVVTLRSDASTHPADYCPIRNTATQRRGVLGGVSKLLRVLRCSGRFLINHPAATRPTLSVHQGWGNHACLSCPVNNPPLLSGITTQ